MKIKELRESAGITQVELANVIGVDRSTVTKWETGEAMPRAALVPKIAEALGCSIGDLYADVPQEGV